MKIQMRQMLLLEDPPETRAKERAILKTEVRKLRRAELLEASRAVQGNRSRHENSLEAYHAPDRKSLATGRRAEILSWLRRNGPATDREVMLALYDSGDLNMVRPRITELLDSGHLHTHGKRLCQYSGRHVRLVAATRGEAAQ